MIRLVGLTLWVSLAAGCGLLSSNLDDFELALPEKQFVVDTAQWGLRVQAGNFPSAPCSVPNDCVVDPWCDPATCVGACVNSVCQVSIPFSLNKPVNLAVENPEFAQVDQSARVRVKEILFEVTENTLNVGTPPLQVFLAPFAVTTPDDPAAQHVGDILPIPAGQVYSGQILFTAEGMTIAETYMSAYSEAFNFIVAGTALIRAGDPVPTGRAVGNITGTLIADRI